MQTKGDAKRDTASPWREAADLLRFSLEAALVSGAIVMVAWYLSGG